MIVKIELFAGRKGSEPTKSDLAKNIDALTRAMSMANAADTALIELRPEPCGGLKIVVRWWVSNELYGYEHAMSRGTMDSMYEAAQLCVLEQITNAVRKTVDALSAKAKS